MPLNPAHIKEQIVTAKGSQAVYPLIEQHLENNEEIIISAINTLLINSKTRPAGLDLIQKIVPLCSPEVLSENTAQWANFCVVQHSNDALRETKIRTLTAIIQSTSEVDNFNKKFLADHLAQTVKILLSSNHSERSLQCLTECIKRFSTWFGNHKPKIETFLLKSFDSSKKNEVHKAAEAFLYLQQTGGAGVDSINYITNFSESFKKLCSTIHQLYNEIFEDLNEIDNTEKLKVSPFEFPSLPINFNLTQVVESISTRLVNTITFLKTMICKQFPVVKQFAPKHVVDVISRGLSVHVCLFSNEEVSLEHYCLSGALNKVQIELFKLLTIVIKGYSSSLLPYNTIISKLLLNSLKRIQSCKCFNESYKEAVYKALNHWILVSKNNSMYETLLSLLQKDLNVLQKKDLTLNFAGPNNKLAKSKQIVVKKEDKLVQHSLQEINCKWSFIVFKSILRTTSVNLKSSIWNEFVRKILKLLFDTQNQELDFSKSCQKGLYEVLLGIYEQDLNAVPSIQTATNLFRNGFEKSDSFEIRECCFKGLDLLEKISQPVCSSLDIPKSDNNVKKTVKTIDMEDVEFLDTSIKIVSDIVIQPAQEEVENVAVEESVEKIEIDGKIIEYKKPEEEVIHNIEISDEDFEVNDEKNEENNVTEEVSAIDDENEEENIISEAEIIELEEEPPSKKVKETIIFGDELTVEEMLLSLKDEPEIKKF